MYAACASAKCVAECALPWSVLDFTSCILTLSACKCLPYMEWLQLWGVWLAIGQIVLPVGCFSVHSWFPPYPSLSAPIHLHVDAQRTRRINTHIASHWPFSGWFLGPFLNHWLHTVKITWPLLDYLDFCINYSHNIIKSPKLIPLEKIYVFFCFYWT